MTPKPPGVHPLAWEYLRAVREVQQLDADDMRDDADGACTRQRRAEDAWSAEGCPLLDDEPPQEQP